MKRIIKIVAAVCVIAAIGVSAYMFMPPGSSNDPNASYVFPNDGYTVPEETKFNAYSGIKKLEGKLHMFTNVSGFPGAARDTGSYKHIFVPNSRRTIAEEYAQGVYSYAYCRQGGLSWSIPYAAGVLAMGFQVHPEYTGEQMLDVLFKTGYMKDGIRFINPMRFIERLQEDK